MNKIYSIKKVDYDNLNLSSNEWENADIAFINSFLWSDNGFTPHTCVRILSSKNGLNIKFDTSETPVLARYKDFNDPVYTDSCVEIFINPSPTTSDKYMNFEMNANGTLLLGIGSSRHDRAVLQDIDPSIFDIKTIIHNDGWSLKLYIPYEFLLGYYTKIEQTLLGNLQKCGEDTIYPHFGTWNPIQVDKPDFHRPEFFGEFILD